jgi:ferritin-like metal-binding protein YciE
MNSDTLETLYISKLRDLYSTEEQLLRALSKMPNEASSEELRDAFENNLEQIKRHVERLEQILNPLAESVVNLEAFNGAQLAEARVYRSPEPVKRAYSALLNGS